MFPYKPSIWGYPRFRIPFILTLAVLLGGASGTELGQCTISEFVPSGRPDRYAPRGPDLHNSISRTARHTHICSHLPKLDWATNPLKPGNLPLNFGGCFTPAVDGLALSVAIAPKSQPRHANEKAWRPRGYCPASPGCHTRRWGSKNLRM